MDPLQAKRIPASFQKGLDGLGRRLAAEEGDVRSARPLGAAGQVPLRAVKLNEDPKRLTPSRFF